jgi:NAD(P)-dependent dehydrogenase (short-subunit alcohol dehydrogenase family)
MTFQGKSVIVTGGARGIGHAIVRRFLEQGASVHIIDLDFPKPFDLAGDSTVHIYTGDISRATDVREFVARVMDADGRVDVLVNNAGIIRDHVIWRMPEEDFDLVLNVNLKGAWLMCKEVAPLMRRQQSGRIINITSRAWLGNVGQSNYAASKGGLVSLTRVLALELAQHNVTVNAVAPGLIDTPLTRNLPPEVYEKLVQAQPGKKAGTPEDIAAAVAFLASEEAGFINGQVLHVDGGKSIGATVF